ncbi:MAG: glycosyltransferase family 9 protein, partial [Candidatus Nealsonbacteria bacterium]
MKTINAKIRGYGLSFFWLFATYLLSPVLYLQILLRRKKESLNPKILIIQIGKIGDMVCTTPIFREIKKKFPQSRLSVIIIPRSKDILKNNPHIDQTILITDYPNFADKFRLINKLRKERYDWALCLDIAGAFLNALAFWSLIPDRITMTYKYAGEIMRSLFVFSNHRLEYKRGTSVLNHRLSLLKFMGIDQASGEKEIFITQEEEKKASDFLKKRNLERSDLLIGISCTSMLEFRQWGLEKFAALADMLIEKLNAKIVFIGAAGDFAKNEKTRKMMRHHSVNASGEFELSELPAFLKNLKLFISMDTGPIYIANTVGVPVVDIVGPDDIREQGPSGPNVGLVRKNIDCAPCSLVFSGIRYCKKGHLRCVKEITPK